MPKNRNRNIVDIHKLAMDIEHLEAGFVQFYFRKKRLQKLIDELLFYDADNDCVTHTLSKIKEIDEEYAAIAAKLYIAKMKVF